MCPSFSSRSPGGWQGLELNDAVSDGGPATSTNVTGSAGTAPKPAITVSVTEPIATNHLKTDACAGVDCGSCVGASAALTITLSGQGLPNPLPFYAEPTTAKLFADPTIANSFHPTDACIGRRLRAASYGLAMDQGSVEVMHPTP